MKLLFLISCFVFTGKALAVKPDSKVEQKPKSKLKRKKLYTYKGEDKIYELYEDEVIARIDLSKAKTEKQKQQMIQEASMQLLNMDILSSFAKVYVKRNNIESTSEYKKDMEQAKEHIEANIAMKFYYEHLINSITEADLKKVYDKYAKEPQYKWHLSIIQADTKAKAYVCLDQLSDLDFAKVAKGHENSKHHSKDKGGDIGFKTIREIVQEFGVEFAQALEALTKDDNNKADKGNGVSSEPVQGPSGFYIFKVNKREVIPCESFETMKEELKMLVFRGKFEAIRKEASNKIVIESNNKDNII